MPLARQGSVNNAQLLYELTFCLWALSFCEEVRPSFLEEHVVEVLVEQVTAAPREKVVRVSLASLRNLCESSTDVITAIIKCDLPKTLANMRERQWADPDAAGSVVGSRRTGSTSAHTYTAYVSSPLTPTAMGTILRWAAIAQNRENPAVLRRSESDAHRVLSFGVWRVPGNV